MKNLRNKIKLLIIIILTICLLVIISIFNIQKYLEEKNNINNSLNVSISLDKRKDNPPVKPDNENDFMIDKNTKFMDSTIYTILIDGDNNIKEIINHSNNSISNNEIKDIANSILTSKNIKNKYIGLLYFNKYSYAYYKGDSLIILDNTNVRNNLVKSLEISILIFTILELLVIYISDIISKWISKPVLSSFEKQKEFIADASHELKTPLSVIIASTYALEKNPNESKWLDNIKNESNHMSNLITNLLDLAKSENKDTLIKNEGNLSKTIELSLLSFEGMAYEKNIKLHYDIKENITFLYDENNIKQLVEILLDNAIKHSVKNSKINIKLDSDNKYITLIIQNKGEGIPKGEEEKIFERFYRVDKSRNRSEGRYGLGLAIAKNIVLNHNGKISASSSDGITTFKVLFKK